MTRPRSVLTLVYVLLVIASLSAANSTSKSNNSAVRPRAESKCHNMYTYNSNFYAGLNKKIETLLHEVKKELSEMKESKNNNKGPNKTIEALLHKVQNELSREMRKEIKSLKENRTTETENDKKIAALLQGVRSELAEMRKEIKSLKENKTNCKGPNKTIETLLLEIKNELGEMKEEIQSLKENKTTGKEMNMTIQGLLKEVKQELSKLGNGIKCLKENATAYKVYKSCPELYKSGHRISGVYTINPDNAGAFDVYCDQTTAGGGWTVFQKRLDGSVDFYRGWDDYKRGFGNLNGEFWLGLDKIHRLTKERSRLRVDLEDFNGKTAYAEYSFFGVGDEGSKYKLSLGAYSGTAGDSLSYHRGMAFSTKDRDNDNKHSSQARDRHCAKYYKGAWWYRTCHYSNLNGLYHKGKHSSFADGVNWYHWKGYYYSVKRAEMKIKPA